ncbi:MAG: ribosomal RNA small subunit methyltransferase A [Candidatus Yonathbacteria bacterium]|nr:ribosomal RNA small subunit methyltransferase A [Candidatus Yonathbacteria bacterium]
MSSKKNEFHKNRSSSETLPQQSNAKFHYQAKKSLGQNFLTSRAVAQDIVATARVATEDVVLEIGPGKGFLTEGLLQKAGKVIAVEKDVRMIAYLKDKFASEIKDKKLELISGDILSLELADYGLLTTNYKLVANIPYYITGEILRTFLSGDIQPSLMVLMVQKEVADRIVARDGKESILSMSVRAYGTPRYIQKVPARYFSPKPKVDSAVLFIENISKNNFKNKKEEGWFFTVMKAGFSQKRKMVRNTLSSKFNKENVGSALKVCGILESMRAEKLNLPQWQCLSNKIRTKEEGREMSQHPLQD